MNADRKILECTALSLYGAKKFPSKPEIKKITIVTKQLFACKAMLRSHLFYRRRMQVGGSETHFEWQGVRSTASQDWMVTSAKGAWRAHAFQVYGALKRHSMLRLK